MHKHMVKRSGKGIIEEIKEGIIEMTSMGSSIIVLSGVCEEGSENHSKISGHMTSGEREFLIPVLV